MFKVSIYVVPPGGGETDYHFEMTLPALPNPEDYIRVTAADVCMTHDFIVRRRWFLAKQPVDAQASNVALTSIVVEVEPALSGFSSEGHKNLCQMYAKRGKPLRSHQDSCY